MTDSVTNYNQYELLIYYDRKSFEFVTLNLKTFMFID